MTDPDLIPVSELIRSSGSRRKSVSQRNSPCRSALGWQ